MKYLTNRSARCSSWLRRVSLTYSLSALVLALGGSVLLAQPSATPQRIISIVPAVTEMLFAIGAGTQVAAVSSFDLSPQASALPRVGALLDPDMERIFSLRPDLVVLYGSQVEQQGQLARASVPVFSYRHGGLADILETIRQLGERTGHMRRAETVATTIEHELAQLRERIGGRSRPRTMLVFGREPDAIRNVYASGGVGFLHDILEAAGGVNVFADVRREAAHPSSESILAAAPDVIIELRAEGATENAAVTDTNAWQHFSALPAVRSGRVHVLTGSELVVPGPRVAEVTKRLAELLHPELFGGR
jgi:iron complex transport system substrate-binding protein